MNENKVRKDLSDWVTESYDCTVFWGESGTDEYPNYQMRGTDDRPDMLISAESTVLVEVKDGDDSSSIYDAMAELHRYWEQIEFGDAVPVASSEVHDVAAFVIATQYSPDGHLFKEEREQGHRQTYTDQQAGWNEGTRPQYEFARTEAIPRIMWRFAWLETEEYQNSERNEIETGVGVLLSDRVDQRPDQSSLADFGTSDQSEPKILAYDGEQESYWGGLLDEL